MQRLACSVGACRLAFPRVAVFRTRAVAPARARQVLPYSTTFPRLHEHGHSHGEEVKEGAAEVTVTYVDKDGNRTSVRAFEGQNLLRIAQRTPK